MTRSEAAGWLAHAQSTPEYAWTEWAQRGVAVLPLGERFCAVRMSDVFVHTATGTDTPQLVAEQLPGPALRDSYNHTYYVLTHPMRRGFGPEAPLLGSGSYLGVPAADRLDPVGVYWVIPPRHPGDLCSLADLSGFINVAYAAPPLRTGSSMESVR